MGGAYQWPRLSEVMQYRKNVRQLMTDLISSAPLSLPITMDSPWVSGTPCAGSYGPTLYIQEISIMHSCSHTVVCCYGNRS